MTNPGGLASDIAAIAAGVPSSRTSTTKWDGIRLVVAEALRLSPDDIYVTTVGGLSRNVFVRLTQSDRGRVAAVGIVMWFGNGTEAVDRAVTAAVRACRKIPRLTLVFSDEGNGMTLAALVKPAADAVPAVLGREYPNTAVIDC